MLVRGVGIRDISKIEEVSIGKVLTVFINNRIGGTKIGKYIKASKAL